MNANLAKRAVKSTILVGMFAGVLGLVSEPGSAQAGSSCSNSGVKGIWGFKLDGDVSGSPLASLGRIYFDGATNMTLTSFTTIAGVTEATSYSGTFSVSADCSGAANIEIDGGDKVTLRLQFVNNARDLYFLLDDPYDTTTAVGEAQRVSYYY